MSSNTTAPPSDASNSSTTTTTAPPERSFGAILQRKALKYYYMMSQQARYYLPYTTFEATQITDQLYLGDINDAFNVDALKERNITNVVTCVKSLEPFYPEQGFDYLNLHLYDMADESIEHVFDESYQYIDKAIGDGKSVLVHCMKGKSRSATILIAYLMRKNHWTYEETFKFVKHKRDLVQPNKGFEEQLKKFQQHLDTTTKQSSSQD